MAATFATAVTVVMLEQAEVKTVNGKNWRDSEWLKRESVMAKEELLATQSLHSRLSPIIEKSSKEWHVFPFPSCIKLRQDGVYNPIPFHSLSATRFRCIPLHEYGLVLEWPLEFGTIVSNLRNDSNTPFNKLFSTCPLLLGEIYVDLHEFYLMRVWC